MRRLDGWVFPTIAIILVASVIVAFGFAKWFKYNPNKAVLKTDSEQITYIMYDGWNPSMPESAWHCSKLTVSAVNSQESLSAVDSDHDGAITTYDGDKYTKKYGQNFASYSPADGMNVESWRRGGSLSEEGLRQEGTAFLQKWEPVMNKVLREQFETKEAQRQWCLAKIEYAKRYFPWASSMGCIFLTILFFLALISERDWEKKTVIGVGVVSAALSGLVSFAAYYALLVSKLIT